MGMVFCRGCGKELHDTAPTCPHCGAPQAIISGLGGPRSIGKLIGWCIVWTAALWFASLVVLGVIAGAMDPQDAQAAGRRVGASMGGLLFLVAGGLSAALTIAGKLPGTRRAV